MRQRPAGVATDGAEAVGAGTQAARPGRPGPDEHKEVGNAPGVVANVGAGCEKAGAGWENTV